MNNKKRGEKIRGQIISDVRLHSEDISKHISNIFSITPQAVNRHIRRLEDEGWLKSSGRGKGKKYFLGELRKHESVFKITKDLSEDAVWRDEYSFVFEDLPENIIDICHYGFTEMVNNAIDHSEGSFFFVSAKRNKESVSIFIGDNGEGIFKKIKRLCGLHDERQALLELSKGKLTTDPDNHTGEGIFFTSRVFDTFFIESKGIIFTHDEKSMFDWITEDGFPDDMIGTSVSMLINKDSKKDVQTVFDEFAGPDEFQFNKTVIPVRLAQYGNEKLVSRSQAKRLLSRIERFKNVVFDFEGVATIGQAFADEIFRVYAKKHSDIMLAPVYMSPNVEKMVKRAMAQNDNPGLLANPDE